MGPFVPRHLPVVGRHGVLDGLVVPYVEVSGRHGAHKLVILVLTDTEQVGFLGCEHRAVVVHVRHRDGQRGRRRLKRH